MLNFPNYDWTFTDAYCLISSGLTDAACDILALSKEIIISDWLNNYDPLVDGKINLKFDIINPSIEQTEIPFVWKSYWDKSQTWLID